MYLANNNKFNIKKSAISIALFFLSLTTFGFSQDLTPFQIYSAKGKKVSHKKFLKKVSEGTIVLFGELHNNSIAHWLELKTAEFMASQKPILLGAEMFETHQQEFLNQYLSGEITHKGLDTITNLWSNYKTDYKPLVDFAKSNNIPFIATNIPREYASFVYKNGLDTLSKSLDKKELELIAPLPIEYDADLPGYQEMLKMTGHSSNPNFPKAQAIKDATMAHFIYQSFKEYQRSFLHFNGDYHSKNYEGIYWYLKKYEPDLNIITISTVEQKNVRKLKDTYKNRADFIIIIEEEMTKSF